MATQRPTWRVLCVLTGTLFFVACAEAPTDVSVPDALFAKKDCSADPPHPGCKDGGGGDDGGSDGGAVTFATGRVIQPADDHWTGQSDLTGEACLGTVVNGFGLKFEEPTECALDLEGVQYDLTNDLILGVKAKRGSIQHLIFSGQDIIGQDGIMHESEEIPSTAGEPDADGVLHVHADDVPVWRLSGHLRGKKVEVVGYISIGDILYSTP